MTLSPLSNIYRPLETPTTIRLLNLEEVGGQLKCTLTHHEHQMQESLFYVAVSYTWVGAVPGSCLNIDGTDCEVSSNVESVLRRFYKRWLGLCSEQGNTQTSLPVWIDGICIDQGDSPTSRSERAAQIKLMDKIYKGATLIVADLGESFYDGLLIPLLATEHPFCPERTRREIEDMGGRQAPRDWFQNEVRKAVEDMVQRVFFQRVWILQEFVLSQILTFLIGDHSYSADLISRNLMKAIIDHLDPDRDDDHLGGTSKVRLESGPGLDTLMFMIILRSMKSRIRLKFSAIVRRACWFDATKEHDKIYGCLALADSSFRDEFHIDYSESLEDLSQRTVRSLIKHERSVAILHQAKGLLADIHECSWSLNMKMKEPYLLRTPSDKMLDAPSLRYFKASLDSEQHLLPAMNQRSPILELSGYEIDHVAHLANRFGESDFFATLYPILVEFSQLISSVSTPAIFTFNSFWRTVIQDYIDINNIGDGIGRAKPRHALYWLCYLCVTQQKVSYLPHASQQSVKQYARYFERSLGTALFRNRLGITSQGHLVVVPEDAEVGDKIHIFLGGDYPFVCRVYGRKYHLVGRCYVHGLMDGEAMRDVGEPRVICIA